jgi:two-component system, NtrC family, nitrogen regulation response regulator NtrX
MRMKRNDTRSRVGTDVLVVNFDDSLRQTYADLLREDGYTVTEAEYAEIASEILERQHVRLMLIDPDLPFAHGIDFLEHLTDPPPVIIVSSHQLPRDVTERLDMTVVGYFEQPLHPARLFRTVRGFLGN